MRRFRFATNLGLATGFAFTGAGCSFLLDFDELQNGVAPGDGGLVPDGTGGGAGSNGQGGDGAGGDDGSGGTNTGGGGNPSGGMPGTGGTPPDLCPMACDDGDACTTDVCTASGCENTPMECLPSAPCMEASCANGICQETPVVGVVADGYEDVLFGENIHDADLVAADGRFFSAVYGVFEGVSDLLVGAFDAEDTGVAGPRTQSLARGLANQGYEIVSPASLVVDDRVALTLNVYVAVGEAGAADDALGDVLRIKFNRDLGVEMSADKQGSAPSYRFVSNRVGPSASRLPSGEPFVVWPGVYPGPVPSTPMPQTGLFFQVGDAQVSIETPGTNFIPVMDPISAVAAVETETVPAVVWMTNPGAGGAAVFANTNVGMPSALLGQCHTDPTFLGYSLHATQTLNDLWTVSWSKYDGASYIAENTLISCSGMACVDAGDVSVGEMCTPEQLDDRVTEDVRNLVVESFTDAANPELLYQVILLAAGQGDGATIALIANRLDLSSNEAPERIGSATVATGAGQATPDWPEVALIPPDKLGVTWIQPTEDGLGEEAHFARYRICPGPPQ